MKLQHKSFVRRAIVIIKHFLLEIRSQESPGSEPTLAHRKDKLKRFQILFDPILGKNNFSLNISIFPFQINPLPKMHILIRSRVLPNSLIKDNQIKLLINQIEFVQGYLIRINSKVNIDLSIRLTIISILVDIIADESIGHFLLEFEYFVVADFACICHMHLQVQYVLQQQSLNSMDNQQKNDQSAQYQEKVKRLLQRWNHTKYETVRCKKQRQTGINEKSEGEEQIIQEEYVIERKKVPVFGKYQVIVVGGGPAGLSAAIAASRAGAQTLIVEKFGCFGGVITTVGMETLGWYRYEGTSDTEGIGRQLQKIAKKMGSTSKWAFNDSDCLDTEQFKLIADRLILQNNIKPLLHTYVVDAIVKEGVIKGIIVESKSGRQAIYGERIVDCSGDADVAYFSGCRYTSLPLEKSLGVTTVFNVAGVDKNRFLEYINNNPQTYKDWNTGTWQQDTTGKQDNLKSPYFGRQFQEAEALNLLNKQGEKNLDITGSWSALSQAGEATNLNLVHMTGYNTLNNEDLTKAEIQGRKGTVKALSVLKQLVPGFENAKLRNLAMTLGVRDSRKIVGRYNLTAEDVCMQGRFADSVGVFPEFIDGYSILILPTTGRYFQIPYGCLVPDIDNLLVAGRCVSGDMVSHAATRNMMCCTVTGQAAGIAAAISLKLGQSTKSVEIRKIQQELKRQQVRID